MGTLIAKLFECPIKPDTMRSTFIQTLLTLSSIVLSLGLTPKPTIAAERVYLNYGSFQFPVSIAALEDFAKTGTENSEIRFITSKLTPEQKAEARKMLEFRLSPQQYDQLREAMSLSDQKSYVYLSRFLNSPTGESLIRDLGEMLQLDGNINGFHGIRAAMVQAEASDDRLSILSFLRHFPTQVQINGPAVLKLFKQHLHRTAHLQSTIARLENIQAQPQTQFVAHSNLPDIQAPGQFTIAQHNLQLHDTQRDRPLPVKLFVPNTNHRSPIPLVVVSNGVGVKPDQMNFLGKHFASHGIAVAIPDHIGSNYQHQQAFFMGTVPTNAGNFLLSEYYERPRDISFMLDELQKRPEFNLNTIKVGIFSYSFGAVTALSLAGAQFDRVHLEKACATQSKFLNFSLVYQCRALELSLDNQIALKDDRIQSLYLLMPMGYSLYGPKGLAQIEQATLWHTTDSDPFTPTIQEHLPALQAMSPDRTYSVISRNLAHSAELVEPSATQLFYQYPQTLATAFFQRHLLQDARYHRYLHPSYTNQISRSPHKLLIESPNPIPSQITARQLGTP
ncbi:MAG: hypothetical protein RLZZ511_1801 [Cyanobacteriota bacterium]